MQVDKHIRLSLSTHAPHGIQRIQTRKSTLLILYTVEPTVGSSATLEGNLLTIVLFPRDLLHLNSTNLAITFLMNARNGEIFNHYN